MAFTDILERDRMTEEVRERLQNEMMFVELETQAGYGQLLELEGCKVLEMQDVSEIWAEILVARLAMYRSLKGQTVARFGAAHFEKWDNAYDHFVGLFKTGELGGCRFLVGLFLFVYFHIFQGGVPLSHNSLSLRLSRNVSIACQKPRCL